MSTSPLLGGELPPHTPSGSDVASLGPSDLSDSGSDVGMGALDLDTLESDSDSMGTGERASAAGRNPPAGADILPDHVEGEDEDEEGDEALQTELDFEQDLHDAQVAVQAEDAAARDRSDAHGLDRPTDVGGLAQQPDEPEDEEGG